MWRETKLASKGDDADWRGNYHRSFMNCRIFTLPRKSPSASPDGNTVLTLGVSGALDLVMDPTRAKRTFSAVGCKLSTTTIEESRMLEL